MNFNFHVCILVFAYQIVALLDRKNCEHSLRLYYGDHLLESVDLRPEDEEFRFKTIPGMEYSVFLKIRSPSGRVLATGEVVIKASESRLKQF